MANETKQILIESILGGHSPMSHFAASDQFRASLGIDPALPADDSGSVTKGIIASGLLRPTGYSTIFGSSSTTISQPPMWLIQNPKNQYTYVYDAQSSLYSLDSNLTTPTVIPDAGELSNGRGNGGEYYDNYIYLSKNTTISRYGPLDGTPTMNGDYWAGTLGKTALIDTTYPVNGSPGGVLSYYKLDGNSTDSAGGNNGTDNNITYAAGNGIIVSGARFTTTGTISTVYNNLVSYWKFDEASGNASDSVGLRTLTNNNATSFVAGKINNGVDLNGTTQYFSAVAATLGISNAWSIAGWVKFDSVAATAAILEFQEATGSGNRVLFEVNGAKFRVVIVGSGGATYKDYSGTSTLSIATYYHIAATWDGASLILYVNGVAETLTKTLDQAVTQTDTARTISIGANYGGANYMNGIADEFGYWSTVLAASDLTTIYGGGSGLALYAASSIGSGRLLNLPSKVSLSCWVKTTQVPSGINPMLFGYRKTGGGYPMFSLNLDQTTGSVSFYSVDSSGVSSQITSSAINNGSFHHLVAVRDGNSLSLYVDGALVGTNTAMYSGNFNNMVMNIGHDQSNTEYYDGSVDECGLFSVALTTAQVTLLYAAGVGLAYPFTTLGSANAGTTLKYPNHVLHRHSDGRLYFPDVVGNQGVIHFIKTTKTTVEGDTDAGSTYLALTLGYGLYGTSLETYGTDLAIALYEGTASGSRGPNAKLAFWDTASQNVNTITFEEFPDNIITSLKNINGVLYITSGIAGQSGFRVSRFIGGSSVEEVFYNELGTAPFAGGVDGDSNRLLFACSSTVPINSASVFSYGLQKAKLGQGLFNVASLDGPLATALIIPQRPSTSSQEGFSFNTPLIGYDTGDSGGEVGCFTSRYDGAPVYWWSQMYRVGRPFKITRIRIPLANAVSSNVIITPKIYIDEGDTTKELTTIDSAHYNGKRSILISPENCAGEHNFWLELKWTGADLCVVGLPIIIEYEFTDD
jgi:hypothetical protein